MMENDQKIPKNDQNVVIHIHKQEGPQFKDSIEIGTPGKGSSVKVYFDAGCPEDAEVRIRNVMRLKKLTQTLYQEG